MFTKLKNWLKKSGISYFLIHPDHPKHNILCGKEMIDSLNPLDRFIESSNYPMARLYRTSFWNGVADTFHILVGNHFDEALSGSGRKGVLDILVFPTIGRRLLGYVANPDGNGLLRIISGLFGILLEIPRVILGILLTAVLTPIVGLVHLFSYFRAKKLKHQVNNLKIEVIPISGAKEQTFGQTFDINQSNVYIESAFKRGSLGEYSELCFRICKSQLLIEYLAIIHINEQNAEGINALLAMNIFQVSRMLEEEKRLDEVKELMTRSKRARQVIVDGMSKSDRNESPLKAFATNRIYSPNILPLVFSYADCNRNGNLPNVKTEKNDADASECKQVPNVAYIILDV